MERRLIDLIDEAGADLAEAAEMLEEQHPVYGHVATALEALRKVTAIIDPNPRAARTA